MAGIAIRGVIGDPAVFFGPSATGPTRISDSPGVLPDAPASGPIKGGPDGLRSFFRSPAGLLIVLVPLAYVLFVLTFGE